MVKYRGHRLGSSNELIILYMCMYLSLIDFPRAPVLAFATIPL